MGSARLPAMYYIVLAMKDNARKTTEKWIARRKRGHRNKENTFLTSSDQCTGQNPVETFDSSLIIIIL